MPETETADSVVCRFCLQEDEKDRYNPFIAPCNCSGSIQYVHFNCIKQWRIHANLPAQQTICQLCLVPYYLPRKWQLEMIPPENEANFGMWFYLSRPWITFVLTNYTYFALLVFKSPFHQTMSHVYLRPRMIGDDPVILFSYLTSLGILTCAYFFYFFKQFLNVVNKRIYLKYLFDSATDYCVLVFVAFVMVFSWPFLFGTIYIVALPRFYTFHKKTLLKINIDGEI